MTFSRKQTKAASSRLAASQAAQPPADFEALFRQHWERLCRLLARLVGDPAEAEDLALETFERLYRRPPQDDQNLGGWLYRVATNLGFNALRARRRRQQYEEEAGFDALENEPAWDPATVFEQAQERERVRAALARLKPRAAQLLMLRHAGLSYAELAQALEIAPGSVGTLLVRAEREFEQYYQPGDQDASH